MKISKNSWSSPKFLLLGVTPAENAEHVKLMKWVVAILSFEADLFPILRLRSQIAQASQPSQPTNSAVAKLSIPAVATDQFTWLRRPFCSHRNWATI
jgi:hypothetical protein